MQSSTLYAFEPPNTFGTPNSAPGCPPRPRKLRRRHKDRQPLTVTAKTLPDCPAQRILLVAVARGAWASEFERRPAMGDQPVGTLCPWPSIVRARSHVAPNQISIVDWTFMPIGTCNHAGSRACEPACSGDRIRCSHALLAPFSVQPADRKLLSRFVAHSTAKMTRWSLPF